MLHLLLAAGAETGLRDEDTGDYPLHAALSYRYAPLVVWTHHGCAMLVILLRHGVAFS